MKIDSLGKAAAKLGKVAGEKIAKHQLAEDSGEPKSLFDHSVFEPVKKAFQQAKFPPGGVGAGVAPGLPVTPQVVGDSAHPSASNYQDVIDQFKPGENPRYKPRDEKDADGNTHHKTYCNVFTTDVLKAAGAKLPANTGAYDANGLNTWLGDPKQGGAKGWKPVSAAEAQKLANQGKPTVATYINPSGSGHIAPVKPGTIDPEKGPSIANAGAHNFDDGHVGDGFKYVPKNEIHYYVYDP